MDLPFDPVRAAADLLRGKTLTPGGRRPVLTRLADVQPERVEWLSPGRLALGKITIIDGDPGQGKSTLAIDWAARITQGRALPDGERIPPGGVVLISPEDGVADTIRPRFEAAGSNLELVSILEGSENLLDRDSGIMPPTIPNDIANIREAIESIGARLLIIDPLFAALGAEISSKSDQDIRRALTPLARLADETGVAVLVIRHLNKTSGSSPLYRGGGSIGIIGVARFGLLLGVDPDDPEARVLASTKCNIGRMPESLKFRLAASPYNPDVALVEWLGASSYDARAVLAGPPEERDGGALTDAREWLRDLLVLGPMPANDVYAAATNAGHSERTVDRAKKALGVRSIKRGTSWVWSFPDEPQEQERQECQERQGSEENSVAKRDSDNLTPGNTERHDHDQGRQDDAPDMVGTLCTLGALDLHPDDVSDSDHRPDVRPRCCEPKCSQPVAAGASYRCELHIREGR